MYQNLVASRHDIFAIAVAVIVVKRLDKLKQAMEFMLTHQRVDKAGDEARQISPLQRFVHFTMTTVFPLPYFLPNETGVEETESMVLEDFKYSGIWYLVEWENIDKDTMMNVQPFKMTFYIERVVLPNLCKPERGVWICGLRLQEKITLQFLWCNFYESLIVIAGHPDIYVIIPGNDAIPKMDTNGGTTNEEITQVVFLANANYFCGNLV